jgi:hypothetical protein
VPLPAAELLLAASASRSFTCLSTRLFINTMPLM